MPSESEKRAIEKYQKQNIKRITIKLNKKTDADIIKYLGTIGNVQGTIKSLLRKEIK